MIIVIDYFLNFVPLLEWKFSNSNMIAMIDNDIFENL